ncbi:MAG: hypothetical protein WC530_09435 [Candidatus Omnitrophota bacterium]|jgi:hypothetical protein
MDALENEIGAMLGEHGTESSAISPASEKTFSKCLYNPRPSYCCKRRRFVAPDECVGCADFESAMLCEFSEDEYSRALEISRKFGRPLAVLLEIDMKILRQKAQTIIGEMERRGIAQRTGTPDLWRFTTEKKNGPSITQGTLEGL